MVSEYSMINIGSIVWFVVAWVGYARFAKYKAKHSYSLSSVISRQRLYWMEQVLERDVRVADVAILANLERNTSFLASTSILILAGLLTAIGVADNVRVILQSLPFYQIQEHSVLWIHIKILVLIFIFVYTFFSLTWSMRQYGFASIMVGAAPLPDIGINSSPEDEQRNDMCNERYVKASSKVIDLAGHAYNYGLRAYYYSLAILPWFISPWLFMVSTTLVIIVLYRREFHSKPYKAMREYVLMLDDHDRSNKRGYYNIL